MTKGARASVCHLDCLRVFSVLLKNFRLAVDTSLHTEQSCVYITFSCNRMDLYNEFKRQNVSMCVIVLVLR